MRVESIAPACSLHLSHDKPHSFASNPCRQSKSAKSERALAIPYLRIVPAPCQDSEYQIINNVSITNKQPSTPPPDKSKTPIPVPLLHTPWLNVRHSLVSGVPPTHLTYPGFKATQLVRTTPCEYLTEVLKEAAVSPRPLLPLLKNAILF